MIVIIITKLGFHNNNNKSFIIIIIIVYPKVPCSESVVIGELFGSVDEVSGTVTSIIWWHVESNIDITLI